MDTYDFSKIENQLAYAERCLEEIRNISGEYKTKQHRTIFSIANGYMTHMAITRVCLDAAKIGKIKMPDREKDLSDILEVLLSEQSNEYNPTILDLCFRAWWSGRLGKNSENGGPCDWFNDTKPMIDSQLNRYRKEFEEITK